VALEDRAHRATDAAGRALGGHREDARGERRLGDEERLPVARERHKLEGNELRHDDRNLPPIARRRRQIAPRLERSAQAAQRRTGRKDTTMRRFGRRSACSALALSFSLSALGTLAAASAPRTARADDAAELNVRDAQREVDATAAQMRAVSQRVREDLRATRKRGTPKQIACVDEALSRSDVALRRAREAGAALLAAYQRSDLDAARVARQRLAELREAQRLAAREGAACSAPFVSVARVSSTTVTVAVDPRIAPVH
jgi:hypothetical protein